jgi:GDP-mannose 4,6 dehydratase
MRDPVPLTTAGVRAFRSTNCVLTLISVRGAHALGCSRPFSVLAPHPVPFSRTLFTYPLQVYGDPEEHPQKETYWGHVNQLGPRACYDEGKRVAETMMYAYHTQGGVEVRVARIFNTFGPRMHPNDGRVVSNFIIQVRAVLGLGC